MSEPASKRASKRESDIFSFVVINVKVRERNTLRKCQSSVSEVLIVYFSVNLFIYIRFIFYLILFLTSLPLGYLAPYLNFILMFVLIVCLFVIHLMLKNTQSCQYSILKIEKDSD